MKNILKTNYTVLLVFKDQDEIEKIKFRLVFDGIIFNFISLNSLDKINETIKNNKIDLIIYGFNDDAFKISSLQNTFIINVCDFPISHLNDTNQNSYSKSKKNSYFKRF